MEERWMVVMPSTATEPVVVTRKSSVDLFTGKALWDLYLTSFQSLRRRAAARQLLNRSEFDLEVLDPRVMKYFARTQSGRVVGLITLSNDLTTVPWISPEFYQARYPAHSARAAVFYCGIAMVHPDARSTRAFPQMVSMLGQDISAADGVLVADMCSFNIHVVELARTVTSTLRQAWGSAELVELDRQVYLAWDHPSSGGTAL
jgi:hypothetical protein